MRFTALLLAAAAPTLLARAATACPTAVANEISTDESPATASTCLSRVDFALVRHLFEIRYIVGAGGTTQTGVGQAASAFAGLELGYGVQFGGDEENPSYEIELTAGGAGQRIGGDVDATGLVTRAGVRLGPAQVAERVIADGRANMAWFPLTMELAHTGELAARPRLSARPELARKLYGRERIEMDTRLLRVETAGEDAQTTAPALTEPKPPSSWAYDIIAVRAGLDVAMQDATRFETTVGFSMFGVTEHTTGTQMGVFGIDHQRIDLPMTSATDLDTLWVFRVEGIDPHTGTQYYLGWGEVLAMPDQDALAERLDPDGKSITIGGVGWFSQRGWGGLGVQYKREPFVTMTGAVELEDRVSAEVSVPRALGLVGRVFGARTTRLVDRDLLHDVTAGVSVDATYAYEGFSSKLGLEVGRTYYTVLDGEMPETVGFAANLGVTIQHSGGHTWSK